MCVVPLGQFLGFQYTINIRVRPVETSYFGKISLTWRKQNLHRKGKRYGCQDCQLPRSYLDRTSLFTRARVANQNTGFASSPPLRPHLPLPRKANLNSNLDPRGILPMMAYAGRLRPKGVSFSGFRYMKGQGFHQLKYKRVGKSLIWVFKQAHRTNK